MNLQAKSTSARLMLQTLIEEPGKDLFSAWILRTPSYFYSDTTFHLVQGYLRVCVEGMGRENPGISTDCICIRPIDTKYLWIQYLVGHKGGRMNCNIWLGSVCTMCIYDRCLPCETILNRAFKINGGWGSIRRVREHSTCGWTAASSRA